MCSCGQFLSNISILDYQLASKRRMQVDIGSLPPPCSNFGVACAIFRDSSVFVLDHFGFISKSSMAGVDSVTGASWSPLSDPFCGILN